MLDMNNPRTNKGIVIAIAGIAGVAAKRDDIVKKLRLECCLLSQRAVHGTV